MALVDRVRQASLWLAVLAVLATLVWLGARPR
jgi:hypothetical protein